MSLIVGIPALIALYVCARKGASDAFLNVYLPVLFLLPDAFRWSLTGHLTFHESAVLPIAIFYLLSSWREWRWSVTDFLVAAMVGIMIVAEFINSDLHEARNVALHAFLTLICPYLLAKGLLRREGLWVGVSRRMAMMLAIVALDGIFELATGMNPFVDLLAGFFPGHPYEPDHVRFGLTRTTGPYAHAILAGIMLAAGYRFARWLDWNNLWPGAIKYLTISKARLCEGLIVLGSILTLSRGPWIAAGLAALVVNLSRTLNRRRAFVLAGIILVISVAPVYYASISYISISPARSATEMQESAAYRYKMLESYASVVQQHPIWGWGRAGFPRRGYLTSIDNHYLLLALSYGVPVAALLPVIVLWSSVRLFARAIRMPRDDPATSLMLTLLGVELIIAFSITLAWLGAQTEPFLFLVFGWSESLLQERRDAAASMGLSVEHSVVGTH